MRTKDKSKANGVRRRAFLLFVFLTSALRIPAQVSTANVVGTVDDTSGAAIQRAEVRLINVQTGTENVSQTGGDGRFFLPGVLPGNYNLQIERTGFATTQLSRITLNIGDIKSFLIRLKVGAITESVTVDASGLTMNTSDATVSTVVDRRFVNTIPLNGRSFQDLVSMTPGIVTQSPQAASQSGGVEGDFSVNGQSLDSNSFYVDGISASLNLGLNQHGSAIASTGPSAGSTALGTSQSLVSVDALQEFRVLSSTYSAEYGRTPGGQFTFLTRSGTSDYHGSLYSYWRGNVFDAPDWFAAFLGQSDELRNFSQNDSGGTLSGPLKLPGTTYGIDRTFLFLSYERLNLTQQVPPSVYFVPSFAVRKEAGPDVHFLDYFPIPSNFGELPSASGQPSGLNYIYVGNNDSYPSHLSATNARLDHTFSPRISAFLRYGDTPSNAETNILSSITTDRVRTTTLTFGTTAQFTARIANDFRLGFAQSRSNSGTAPQSFLYQPGEPTFGASLGLPSDSNSSAASSFADVPGVGGGEVRMDTSGSSINQWNIRNTLSVQADKHLLRFGIDQRHVAFAIQPAALSIKADFFNRQSLVDGTASDVALTKTESARPVFNEFSAFAEDQFRVADSLTLSFGLRWEVSPAPYGRNGADAYTARGDENAPQTLTLAPRGTPLWHTSWFNFAPRFGAAWMVGSQPGREMVLRIGSGVFFDTGNQPALQSFTGAGFTRTNYISSAPVPVAANQLDFSAGSSPPFTNSTVFAFPAHLQLPYSIQWDVAFEKAFGKEQALTISYVGSHGVRLFAEQRRNVNRNNPSFGDVVFFPNGVTSNYNSLQMKFQRSLAHGVEALASYTWAHALDYGSTDPDYPFVYGNSDLDVRQNLESALSWDFPSPHSSGLKYFLGNWGLDGRLIARSSFPVTLLGNLFSDPLTGQHYYTGVDLIPNRPLYIHSKQYPGRRTINGGPNTTAPAFVLPDGAQPGNAPRNLVRGFDAIQTNFAIRKEVPIHDRVRIQLGAESFNLLNHPNFGYIDSYLNDTLFGQSTRMLDQSFGPSGSLYQQGGPRSTQLSFRLVF